MKNAKGKLVVAPDRSKATHTHVGVDIAMPSGIAISPIYAFSDGTVHDVIASGRDADSVYLGYMVIIKHSVPIGGKETYSIYLHMRDPPLVKRGDSVWEGTTILGYVGETGAADGPHTHFEIRHFASRYLEDARWNDGNNIYGKGDQRFGPLFCEKWEDPERFLDFPNRGVVSQKMDLSYTWRGMLDCKLLEIDIGPAPPSPDDPEPLDAVIQYDNVQGDLPASLDKDGRIKFCGKAFYTRKPFPGCFYGKICADAVSMTGEYVDARGAKQSWKVYRGRP